MEPLIPNGSYCLFKYGVAGSRNGRVVLVQKSGYEDPETQASFTIKRYYSQKSTSSEFDQNENEWQHEKIELRPDSKDYPILTIKPDEAEDFTVI
jgi:phage repressor protein C with HTH and peptisase S24 domain